MPAVQLVILVLDTSSSMADPIAGAPEGTTKAWQVEEAICRPLCESLESAKDRKAVIDNAGLIARLQYSQRRDFIDLGIILFDSAARLYQKVRPVTEWELSPIGTRLSPPNSSSDPRYILDGQYFNLLADKNEGTNVTTGLTEAKKLAEAYVSHYQNLDGNFEPFVHIYLLSDLLHNQGNPNEIGVILREFKQSIVQRARPQISFETLVFGGDANLRLLQQIVNTRHHSPDKSIKTIFNPGTQFGNYILTKNLGSGGVGTVYKARHKLLNNPVALKVHEYFPSDEFVGIAFLQSANYLSQLNHPNIVKLYDYGFQHKRAYIVMEFVEGQTLARRIPQIPTEEWTHKAINIFVKLLSAVRYAHNCIYLDLSGTEQEGVLHGDIKPQNILIRQDGEVKLMDFMSPEVQAYVGTKQLPFEELRQHINVVDSIDRAVIVMRMQLLQSATFGTPGYMPKEQQQGRVTEQADIYALGATLYEMMTGRNPITFSEYGKKPRQINPFVPDWVETVITKAMTTESSGRYESVAEMEFIFYEQLKRQKIFSELSIKEYVMGDKIEIKNTGTISNASGQLFIGKFNDVMVNLNNTGQTDLAEALKVLKEAIMASSHIPDEKKEEHVDVINQIGDEATKDKPNKTLLKIMTDGLLSALKAVPDVAKAVAAIAPFLTTLTK